MTPKNGTRGDASSQSPLSSEIEWLSDLKRSRKPGPFFGDAHGGWSGPSTTSVHAGTSNDPRTGAVGTPIYQSSTFLLEDDQ